MPSHDAEQTRRKIASLESETGWYQCIDLGQGIMTKTKSHWGEPLDYPMPTWRAIRRSLPDDLQGLRVLDIGCNAGFFSIEARRRNAEYVLGIDEVPGYIRQAQFAAEVLGLEIDYQRMNIYDLSRSGMKFDIVLALGVIYHCKHPLLAAENIAAVCDGMAIVESHVVKSPGLFRRNEPIWSYVYDGYKDAASNLDKKEGDYNWWFPNMEGLISLFRTVGFSKVETIHEETRGSIACHK